jgi:very-short-patch-repair endonuclease
VRSCVTFHDFDFFLSQTVEVIDEAVDLCVGGGDLAFQRGLSRFRPMAPEEFPLPAIRGEGLAWDDFSFTLASMNPVANARRLRREQTDEEKELWQALRAGRFAGFKFRRQHSVGKYFLDSYCPAARLSIELDGFQHGLPEQIRQDREREQFLASQDIEELRFWNHQWRKNREGVLLEIWQALHRRTGCVKIMRKVQNHRFAPPDPDRVMPKPPKP